MKRLLLLFLTIFTISTTCFAIQENDVGEEVEKVFNQDQEIIQSQPLGMVKITINNDTSEPVNAQYLSVTQDRAGLDFFTQFAPKDVGWDDKNKPINSTNSKSVKDGSSGGNPGRSI